MPETQEIIRKYALKYIKEGYDADDLAKTFIEKGYSKEDVGMVIKEIQAERKPKEVERARVSLLDKFRIIQPRYILITLSLVVLIAAVLAALNLFTGAKNCGYDKECFIDSANICSRASVKEEFRGSTIQYSIGRNCVLKKRIISFAEEEPIEIQTLFRDKTMECSYERGNFNELLIEGLLGGIDNCEGSLKDTIYELRIAQYMAI